MRRRIGRATALLALAALAGCASAAKEEAAPTESERGRAGLAADPIAPVPEPVDIYVDAGERELGAYQIKLVFDRALVRVAAVEPFPGGFREPDYDPKRFTSGELILAAYLTHDWPRGRVGVARVTFESLAGQSSTLMVRVMKLVDPEAVPIKGSGAASRDRVP